jgi:hypothetical protein
MPETSSLPSHADILGAVPEAPLGTMAVALALDGIQRTMRLEAAISAAVERLERLIGQDDPDIELGIAVIRDELAAALVPAEGVQP